MNYGREAITLVEIDQPLCRNTYGAAPCAAALGVTGTRKCFNTRFTCQDAEHYDVSARGAIDAAAFDGVNDYLARGANLAGIANAKSGTVSLWLRLDDTGMTTRSIMSDVAGVVSSTWMGQADGVLQFNVYNNALAQDQVYLQSAKIVGASSDWHQALLSWDAATGARHLYVDDANVLDAGASFSNNVISEWTLATDWLIGDSIYGGIGRLWAALAEFYFAPGQYLDLSVEGNRRLFRSAAGRAVSLGADGSAPTGIKPAIYLHLDQGEAVADFALNRGTGGNFSISGTLAAASTAPPAGEEASVLTLRFAFDQDGVPDYGPLLPALTGLTTTPGSINLAGMDTAASALGTREVVTLKFDDSLHSDLGVDPYRLERIDGAAQQE